VGVIDLEIAGDFRNHPNDHCPRQNNEDWINWVAIGGVSMRQVIRNGEE
jgi:hypothetical protein